jgi:carbohydrate-binding DOMON domain-containing protein
MLSAVKKNKVLGEILALDKPKKYLVKVRSRARLITVIYPGFVRTGSKLGSVGKLVK